MTHKIAMLAGLIIADDLADKITEAVPALSMFAHLQGGKLKFEFTDEHGGRAVTTTVLVYQSYDDDTDIMTKVLESPDER